MDVIDVSDDEEMNGKSSKKQTFGLFINKNTSHLRPHFIIRPKEPKSDAQKVADNKTDRRVPPIRVVIRPKEPKSDAAKSDAEKLVDDKKSPRVPPIRVVKLASLQNPQILTSSTDTSRTTRRKAMHQVKQIESDQMVFIESNSNDGSGNSTPSNSIRKKNRPNLQLMKRIAFLRVCAEYMLKELQIKNVSFGENQSLEMIKAQYLDSKFKRDQLQL